jgi:transcription antitermination factor NusG
MVWHLFVIDTRRHEVCTAHAKAVEGVQEVIYKMVETPATTTKGKKYTKKVAVFPGYMFVDILDTDLHHSQSLILESPWVRRLVGTLSDAEVNDLYKLKEDNNYSKKFVESFSEGDQVRIVEGLFKGYEATILSVKGNRILIQTSLNGKEVTYSALPGEILFIRRPS